MKQKSGGVSSVIMKVWIWLNFMFFHPQGCCLHDLPISLSSSSHGPLPFGCVHSNLRWDTVMDTVLIYCPLLFTRGETYSKGWEKEGQGSPLWAQGQKFKTVKVVDSLVEKHCGHRPDLLLKTPPCQRVTSCPFYLSVHHYVILITWTEA